MLKRFLRLRLSISLRYVLCCAVLCVTMQSDGYVYHTSYHMQQGELFQMAERQRIGRKRRYASIILYCVLCTLVLHVRTVCRYAYVMPLSLTQTGLADHIVRCFEMGSRPRVYLDKVRLLDGQRFDIGFTVGLAQSTVSQTPLPPAPFPTPLPLPPSLRASVHLCFCCVLCGLANFVW